MSINREMKKENVLHVNHRMLLSHSGQRSDGVCSNGDGARDCHNQ